MAYQRFNRANDIVENQRTTISSGLWSGGSSELTAFYTQSTNGNITGSFLELYNEDPNLSSSAEVQFAVGYAHLEGSGSKGNTTKLTDGGRQTAALYRQFRNVLLAPNTDRFEFTSSPTASGDKDFYFVSFQRARQREKIDPGNWELKLSGNMPALFLDDKISLIDDSGATTNPTVNQGGRVFNVVSGSIATGDSVFDSDTNPLGLFFPNHGIIVLSQDELGGRYDVSEVNPINFAASSSNANDNNAFKLFSQVSASQYFVARREESVKSTHYFCRVNHDEFNYSSNPTYQTGSGDFVVPSFKQDPKAYITTVGLYNESNDLLAVAK